MYAIQMDHIVYEGYRDGTPFSLVSALREVRGVGGAQILRADGTVAVTDAGSTYAITHAPTGRTIVRRKVR